MKSTAYVAMLQRDLGPSVMHLFEDESVTEIGKDPGQEQVWIDSRGAGRKILTDVRLSNAHVTEFLNRVAHENSMVLTPESPEIEAALPHDTFGGARLTGLIPPIVRQPSFNIRILSTEAYPLEVFIEGEECRGNVDSLFSQVHYDQLVRSIKARDNIFIVGEAGSGKTTLAMSILRKISDIFPDERIVTMEDTPELIVHSWCHSPLITSARRGYADLIKTSLRLSPDRLVMGECRGPAILELFDSVLSGHPGTVTTFHSQTVRKALRRMMLYCRRTSETDSHRYTIADAVDLMLVLQKRGRERKITEMVRIMGYEGDYLIEPAVISGFAGRRPMGMRTTTSSSWFSPPTSSFTS